MSGRAVDTTDHLPGFPGWHDPESWHDPERSS